MSRDRRNYGQAAYDKNRNGHRRQEYVDYVYGNTVRRIPQQEWQEEPVRRQAAGNVRKNREKARHMSLGYVTFLVAAMCAAAFVLINYIQLQAALTQKTKTVAAKEVELNNLKLANDEEYNRILSGINLEDIKRIAIGELGMTYAGEGQIVTYANEKNDYMRRVSEADQ